MELLYKTSLSDESPHMNKLFSSFMSKYQSTYMFYKKKHNMKWRSVILNEVSTVINLI
jgi:hypothetical protein